MVNSGNVNVFDTADCIRGCDYIKFDQFKISSRENEYLKTKNYYDGNIERESYRKGEVDGIIFDLLHIEYLLMPLKLVRWSEVSRCLGCCLRMPGTVNRCSSQFMATDPSPLPSH